MDGTGKLFEPIKGILPTHIDVEVIPLSRLKDGDAKSQAEEIAALIGNGEFVIFAESYSGAIAYELCQIPDLNINHVFFAASFLSRPSYISKFGYLAPLSILRVKLIPTFILSWLFFGSLNRPDLVDLFLCSLKLVSNNTLRQRLKRIANLNEPESKIRTPCTYLQATKDKLVSKRAIAVFQKLCVNLDVKQINGGHFIAQSNPEKCAEAISGVFALLPKPASGTG